jgi:hypothetical protein
VPDFRRVVSWLVVLLAGCGGRRGQATAHRDHAEAIADRDDRCSELPRECFSGYDGSDDGCPDPPPLVIRGTGGGAAGLLDRIGAEVHRLAPGATLLLIVEVAPGEAEQAANERGAHVGRALAERGVPHARVRVEPVHGDAAQVVVGVEGCAFGTHYLDADGDGILDHRDACPDHPEDIDGHQDDDGCPDFDHDCHPVDPAAAEGGCSDRDHDGVPDGQDRCPDRPGPAANAGCPRPRAPRW